MTTRKKGLLVAADDFHLGRFYAVHSLKNAPDEPVSVAGQEFKVLAMNLPFVVGKINAHPPITFVIRFLNYMPVTPEYVEAQQTTHVPDAN